VAEPSWLEHDGARLACQHQPGSGANTSPGVLLCGGFRSNMQGGKALALADFCARRGLQFTRFDYRGHGQSSGRFDDATLSEWIGDAQAVLRQMTHGPQVVIGSSMGAWIATHLALREAERVCALMTLAAAPDFSEDVLLPSLDDTAKAALAKDGLWLRPSRYDSESPDPISQRFLDDARQHLLLRGPIGLDLPVRMIHGQQDPDIPWRTSLRLAEQITGDDVQITLIKDAGHRLSRDSDIALILDRLEGLLSELQTQFGDKLP
jgi:pimeloyl-ACP methyl ester carboxylesterase